QRSRFGKPMHMLVAEMVHRSMRRLRCIAAATRSASCRSNSTTPESSHHPTERRVRHALLVAWLFIPRDIGVPHCRLGRPHGRLHSGQTITGRKIKESWEIFALNSQHKREVGKLRLRLA